MVLNDFLVIGARGHPIDADLHHLETGFFELLQ